ncbi:hypothetical protein CTA2_9070 [Colletotrichum tanaceti]|uniref:Uncharacterized protein n=1 Tax=Colletotrichum tanaceti TaxID=1306861 RepID=A0A4U6X6H4_9PEZI|nr:hypothetical protein CTA2_9070 [Colletotrichum tanaceti]TKW50479.1 hypothetical protein CTA1_5531 [Colletotrichum tanaceti]
MEDCSSIDYSGSLLTVCSTDKYRSICLDDRSGHVSCNVTMGGPFSIDRDLAHFFLPYGTVAWISNVIGFWIWIALMNGKTPLNLSREIKHTTLVSVGAMAWIVFLVVGAIIKVPKMESRDLKIITICQVLVAVTIHGPTLCLMRKGLIGDEESKTAEEQTDEDRGTLLPKESAETMDENVGSRCPSSESARSTPSISSTIASASEKTGFLDSITSSVTGLQRTDTKPSTEEEEEKEEEKEQGEDTDPSKEANSTTQGTSGLFLGGFGVSLAYITMFYGVVGIAKKVFASRGVTDVRQQREVRDALILFGVLLGIAVVGGVLGLAGNLDANSKQSADEESVDRAEREKTRAAEAKKTKEAVVIGVLVLGGTLSVWCQYFVLAAAARDTHGIAHLGNTSNLSLAYLMVSNMLLFAF